MESILKIGSSLFPVMPYFPRWLNTIFILSIIGFFASLILYGVYYNTASKRKDISTLLSTDNLTTAIQDIGDYRENLQNLRDEWNVKGLQLTQKQRFTLEKDYERYVRPFVVALKMNDPGEKVLHNQTLSYQNPVDHFTKDFTFYNLNLSLTYLSKVLGRLEFLQDNPELIGSKETY